jgi:RimJ/RimL family protein N-acetyltransferase
LGVPGRMGGVTKPAPWPRHTDRLLLRYAVPADLDVMIAYRVTAEVNRWMLSTAVDPERYRASWLAAADDPDDFSVVGEFEGRVIGSISMEVGNAPAQGAAALQPGHPAYRSLARIGYVIDPAFAGRGFATELVQAMLDVAFGELGIRRVVAGCFADNPASARVLEKAGLRREAHTVGDAWHDELGWIDGYEYALLGEEWRALQRAGPPEETRERSGWTPTAGHRRRQ